MQLLRPPDLLFLFFFSLGIFYVVCSQTCCLPEAAGGMVTANGETMRHEKGGKSINVINGSKTERKFFFPLQALKNDVVLIIPSSFR